MDPKSSSQHSAPTPPRAVPRGQLHTQLQQQTTPLGIVRTLSDDLMRATRANPLLSPIVPGRPETQTPHKLEAQAILQLTQDAVGAFIALGAFVQHLNTMGQRSSERHIGSAAALLPLALFDVHNRRTANRNGGNVRLNEPEDILLTIYAKAHDGNLPVPEWYWPAYPFTDLSSKMENLPGIDTYIRESKNLAATAAPLIAKLEDLTAKHLEALAKADRFTGEDAAVKANGKGVVLRGADAGATERQRAEQLAGEKNKVLKEMMGHLHNIADVRPELLEGVCGEVQVSATIKPEIVRAAIEATRAVAELIALALDPEYRARRTNFSVLLPQPVVKDHNATIAHLKLDPANLGMDLPPESISQLLNTYAGLRNTLTLAFDNFSLSHLPEHRRLRAEIDGQLQRLFPVEVEATKKVLAAVLSSKDPGVQNAAVNLLTTKVRIPDSVGTSKSGTIFESAENVEFLAWAVNILLRGSDESATKIKESLQHSSLQPVVNFTSSIRTALSKGDVMGIAVALDDEIKVCKELGTSAPYGRLAALMLTMLSVSKDESLRRNVKSVLQRLDDVSEIARGLTSKVSDKDKGSAAFIENCRSNIVRLFSVDLSDYWGYEKLVNEYRGILEEHLLLLQTPKAWRGLNPSDVFLNGHLIYGPPGVGKTFLVQCMANTLGIPLLRISREEMSGAYGDARAEAKIYGETKVLANKTEERMEAKLTKFIREKISDAEAAMRKSQKHACMLFFDEIEGEMVEREIVKDSPDQIALTNAMLRVIEREISKHPEVIFVAATNHIELVDKAARRPGRFGVHLPLTGPQREDVATIVRRTLELQGIKSEKEETPEFKALCDEALGMNPLPIKLAILNRCCVLRAKAMAAGKEEAAIDFNDLKIAMTQMKRLSSNQVDLNKPNIERDVHTILGALQELAKNSTVIAAALEKFANQAGR